MVYIDKLNLSDIKDKNEDYLIKTKYPLDYGVIDSLLEIESKERDVLDNVYLEFEDELPLSGQQIINFCNNLNLNLLIRKVSKSQMEELLVGYANSYLRKVVYPAKIVVLISLMFLYRLFFHGQEIPEDLSDDVKLFFDKIKFDCIEGYDLNFISDWVRWYLSFLAENKRDFLENFVAHCFYLFEVAYSYRKGLKIDREYTDELKSGLYVPLAFVMRDFRFNPFKIPAQEYSFNYVKPGRGEKYVVMALSPVVHYTVMVEEYLKSKKTGSLFVEDLSKIEEPQILDALKNKKVILTKSPISSIDLFPLEIVDVSSKEHLTMQS